MSNTPTVLFYLSQCSFRSIKFLTSKWTLIQVEQNSWSVWHNSSCIYTSAKDVIFLVALFCLFSCVYVCILAILFKSYERPLVEIYRIAQQWYKIQSVKLWWWSRMTCRRFTWNTAIILLTKLQVDFLWSFQNCSLII